MAAPDVPATLEQGAGSTAVFLLHGVGGGKAAWKDNLGAIGAAGYRAIAWDMPGYGDSATIDPYTTQGLAASLHALIVHVGAPRNVVLGHSMGGMVAQELVAQAPRVVQGLILSGTSPAFGNADGAWQQSFLRERFAPLDDGRSMAELAAQLVPSMMATGATPQAILEAQIIMAGVPQETYRAAMHAIVSFNRLDALARIAVPTLCLAGEHDRNASPGVMRRMAERVAGAQFACLPGVGHLANIERASDFNAAVLQFLQTQFPV